LFLVENVTSFISAIAVNHHYQQQGLGLLASSDLQVRRIDLSISLILKIIKSKVSQHNVQDV
jgi:hypothetical protein